MQEDPTLSAKPALGELLASASRWAATPVDVRGASDDGALDDHLSVRLGAFVGDSADVVNALSGDLRAYYVTRLFEREYGSGGVTGFLDWGAGLGPLVSEGYRHLGLPEAAAAFRTLWSMPALQRLATDEDYQPTDDEQAELRHLAEAVGRHDEERIAFVRRHPEVFSI